MEEKNGDGFLEISKISAMQKTFFWEYDHSTEYRIIMPKLQSTDRSKCTKMLLISKLNFNNSQEKAMQCDGRKTNVTFN